jgi:hypothetical protein
MACSGARFAGMHPESITAAGRIHLGHDSDTHMHMPAGLKTLEEKAAKPKPKQCRGCSPTPLVPDPLLAAVAKARWKAAPARLIPQLPIRLVMEVCT